MEQQVNPGFLQSPVHKQKKSSLSELETSFSDSKDTSKDTDSGASVPESADRTAISLKGLMLPPKTNGEIHQIPGVVAGSPNSLSSTVSGQGPPVSYINGSVNLPWQYYQYLQQMAMMNPAILAMPNGGPPPTPHYLQPKLTSSPQATPQDMQPSTAAKIQHSKGQTPANPGARLANSQIYEEIPNAKMYGDIPKLPAPRQQRETNQEPSDNSTDSLLQPNTCRKKINPLYGDNVVVDCNAASPSEPSSSEPFSSHYTKKELKCNSCICTCFVILAIVTCAALAITLLTATGVLSLQKDVTAPSQTTIKPVVAAVSGDVSSNITDMISSYQQLAEIQTENLNQKIKQLELQLKNLTESQHQQELELTALASRFPLNALNGALCKHNISKYPLNSPQAVEISTSTVPSLELLEEGFVVVGVTCTSNNYINNKLETEVDQGRTRYRCVCSDLAGGSDNWCAIDYWMCPTIT